MLHSLESLLANKGIKKAGICWAITTEKFIFSGNSEIICSTSNGPPVEEPITKAKNIPDTNQIFL